MATWNVRYLSDGSRDDIELAHIADITKRYDFVAVQQARDTDILDRLIDTLPNYEYMASPEVGRGQTEIYAYVYRDEVFEPLGTAYVVGDSADRREELELLDEVVAAVEEANGPLVEPSTPTTITESSSYENFWIDPEDTTEFEGLIEVYAFDESIFDNDDLAGNWHTPAALEASPEAKHREPAEIRIHGVVAHPSERRAFGGILFCNTLVWPNAQHW